MPPLPSGKLAGVSAAPSRTNLVGGPSAPQWELAFRRPARALQPWVRDYCGYTERTGGLTRRRELPAPQAVLIFELGPPLRVSKHGDTAPSRHRGGFVAGVGDTFSITEHDGLSRGIQVNLTPIGARLALGVPMAALCNRVVSIDDVVSAADRGISERLEELPDWDARFDMLDDFLARRIARARPAGGAVAWALDRIQKSGGLADIGALSKETGYCHKHLIALFREHVGLPPKRMARLVRFDAVMRRLRAGGAASWAHIAADHGFYDQAHLARELRHFSGLSPSEAREHMTELADLFPD